MGPENEETGMRHFIYDDKVVMIFNHQNSSAIAAMIDKDEGEIDKEEYLKKHILKPLTDEDKA